MNRLSGLLLIFLLYPVLLFSQNNLLSINELQKQKKYTNVNDVSGDQVYILSLSNQQLKDIPKKVFSCKKLQYLDLRNNKLTSVPVEILQLKNLQYVILSKNSLVRIPSVIYQLKNIKVLDLSGNKLSGLPKGISTLSKLEELNIENNSFNTMPVEICDIKTLKVLKIWNNPFVKIPNAVCRVKNLNELYINSDQLLSLLGNQSSKNDSKITLKQCVRNEEGLTSSTMDPGQESKLGSLIKLKKLHVRKKGLSPEKQAEINTLLKTTKIIYY